jgi:hypothetical protein
MSFVGSYVALSASGRRVSVLLPRGCASHRGAGDAALASAATGGAVMTAHTRGLIFLESFLATSVRSACSSARA